MEKVYVRLTPADVEAVKALSREERRHPSDQLAVMVQDWLRGRAAPAAPTGTPHAERPPVSAGAD